MGEASAVELVAYDDGDGDDAAEVAADNGALEMVKYCELDKQVQDLHSEYRALS